MEIAISKPALAPAITASKHPGCTVGSPSPKKPIAFTPISAASLRTLIKYGFEELNMNRIWCEVYSNNDALHIYKHLDFVEEGVLRQNYYAEGKYWDSHILSMLKEEYLSK